MCVRDDKRGFIPVDIKPLFERLSINEEDWLTVIKGFNRHFISAAGNKDKLALGHNKQIENGVLPMAICSFIKFEFL